MPATGTKTGKKHDENIKLRASQSQKKLIDRAADSLGRNRSDFMLETGVPGSGSSSARPSVFRVAQRGIQPLYGDAGQTTGQQCEAATTA